VSRLGLGSSTFGTGTGPFHKVDQKTADAMVARALDLGINLFNAADVYNAGQSEEMLGRAVRGRRADVVIATKCGGQVGATALHRGLSRRHIVNAVEGSLRRLGTDYIDVYGPHRIDPYTPIDETLDVLDSLVRSGKVRYLGVSNWPAWLVAKAAATQRARGWHRYCASESYYSLLGRDIEHELVPCLDDARIGLVAWSPLAMGYLTGRYTGEAARGGRVNATNAAPPIDRELGDRVVAVLRRIGSEHGASPSQIAIAWLLAKPCVDSVLLGASSLDQFDENVAAYDIELTAAEVAQLDELTAPPPMYPAWHYTTVQKLGTPMYDVGRPAWVH
jgi:aryl-alcohol dehydrogenase-like predicted oxidoreductase